MKTDDLCVYWSHLYHITAEINLHSIRKAQMLWPTRALLAQANLPEYVRKRRTEDIVLHFQHWPILLRNQIPLDPNSIALGSGCTLEEYIACLNSYIFFWPGTADRATADAVRMFERTNATRAIAIRVPTRSLVEANASLPVYVTSCNTGLTWTEQGIKAPQGPNVFKLLKSFPDEPGRIHEICFKSRICLSDNAQIAISPSGPWNSFSDI